MPSFYVFAGAAVIVWLFALVSAALAVLFSRRLRQGAALSWSIVSLLVSSFGLSLIHVSASSTVNGVVQWSFNSRWFFVASLLLGLLSLTFVLWNRRNARSKTSPNQPPLV